MTLNNSIPKLFKGAFGGLSPQVWLLALIMFINRSGTMVILFMTIYATEKLHFSLTQAGVIMGLFGAGSFLGVLTGGKLTDKLGGKKVMQFSLLLGGVMFIILGTITQYFLFAVCIFFTSFFGEAFRPANSASIASHSHSNDYTRSISLNRLAINLGFSIGPALGGILASYNYNFLFIADGVTCISAGLIIAFFLKDSRAPTHEIKKEDNNTYNKYDSPYHDKKYLLFAFFCVLYAVAFFQMFSTMPLYYKQVHHLSEFQIGWLMALNGLGVALIEMVMIYKIEGRMNPLNFIFLGAALLMINYLILIFAGSFSWLVLSMLLITFSEMFAMPFMSSYMMQRAASHKIGAYAAVYSMTWSIAQVASPLISTSIIDTYGFNYLWIFMAAISLAVGLGMRSILAIKEGI